MTLDHQIVHQTLKRSHPPTPSSALLVQHGHQSPESNTGPTGNPLTKLLTLGKEDDNVEWHVCLMAAYENISSVSWEKKYLKKLKSNFYSKHSICKFI